MKKQAINLNAERLDPAGIVSERNRYRIGPWQLLYNGKENAASFAFDEIKPNTLRVRITGSTGYVRLLRPLVPVGDAGIYSISLSLRSLTRDAKSSCQPYIFSSPEPYRFDKHSKLLPRDGKYVTKLHLSGGGGPRGQGPSFWIGFETLDRDIELHLGHVRLEIVDGAEDLARSLRECKTVDLPLVFSESKCRHYTDIEARNGEYHKRIKQDEVSFLIDYAAGLRAVEMPDTYVRMIRYLVVKYRSLPRPQQTSLAAQVRAALRISQDETLIALVNRHCPELMMRLDVSPAMLAKLAMLPAPTSDALPAKLDMHAYFTEQDDPARLFALVHRECVRDANFLLANPQSHCALANAYAARPGCESRYVAFVNRYLEAYQLPVLESATFGHANALEGLSFSAVAPMEQGPLVSIVMSAFQAADTIGYAIDSLLAQSWRNLEVLVCDDGSEDGTLEIARDRAARDPRVRVFRSRDNQGTYNIRNDLIAEARGEFVTFHDSDDLALPCRIEAQLDALASQRATVCFSSWVRLRPDGSFVHFHDGLVNRFCVVSAMAHRSVFDRLPPFRSSLVAADTEFHELCKFIFGESEIAIVKRPLIFGLWGDGSLTRRADLTADHSGYVAQRRRSYAEVAARQRVLGDALVEDVRVDDTLKALGLFREHAGVVAA